MSARYIQTTLSYRLQVITNTIRNLVVPQGTARNGLEEERKEVEHQLRFMTSRNRKNAPTRAGATTQYDGR